MPLQLKKHTTTLLLATWMLTGSISANTAFTKMRDITALQLTADMGVGWNLGNTMDASPKGETGWGNPMTTQAMIDAIRQKGFKSIRIPTTWYPHLGPAPEFSIDTAWMNRVETILNYAFKNDMYVILNLHHEDFSKKHTGTWLNPTRTDLQKVEKQLVKVWTQIAKQFKTYGDHLIFETMNEPRVLGTPEEWTGGTSEGREAVNQLNVKALRAIRSTGGNNAKRFVMCPAYAANSGAVALEAYVVPDNDPRVIVSIHNYGPYSFCMQVPGTNTWGSEADKRAIDNDMDYYYKSFISKGIAVVIGEWGSIDKKNASERAVHAAYFARAAAKRKIATLWWDNGLISREGFALFNRRNLNWFFPEVADSIVQSVKLPTP